GRRGRAGGASWWGLRWRSRSAGKGVVVVAAGDELGARSDGEQTGADDVVQSDEALDFEPRCEGGSGDDTTCGRQLGRRRSAVVLGWHPGIYHRATDWG